MQELEDLCEFQANQGCILRPCLDDSDGDDDGGDGDDGSKGKGMQRRAEVGIGGTEAGARRSQTVPVDSALPFRKRDLGQR